MSSEVIRLLDFSKWRVTPGVWGHEICFVGLDYLPLIDPSVFKLNIMY